MFRACPQIFDFVDDFRKSFDIPSLWAESHTELFLGGFSVISSYCLLKSDKRNVCFGVFGLDLCFCLIFGSWDLGLNRNVQTNI